MTAIPQQQQACPYVTGRLLVFTMAAVIASITAQRPPAQWPWASVAVAAIAIAIWHGAFDGVLAEETLRPQWGARWKPAFYVSYLGATVVVILLWWVVPVAALALFLLYSALHFGTEGERHLPPRKLLTGLAAGFLPIAAACRWWPVQVAAIFGDMLRGDKVHAAALASLAGRMLWPLVAVAFVGAWQQRGHRFAATVLILTELILFRGCSPVAAFAIFFCLWHTPEHMVSTSLDSTRRFQGRLLMLHLRQGIVPWLLSLCAVAILFWYGRHTMEAYLGVLFITLSALTVPHMVLAEVRRRRENDTSDPSRTRFVSEKAVTCG